MNTILLAFLLTTSCPKTLVINKSKLPWVKHDTDTKNYCQKRCPYEYKDAPCLKKFFKLGFQDYFCQCGKP